MLAANQLSDYRESWPSKSSLYCLHKPGIVVPAHQQVKMIVGSLTFKSSNKTC